MGKVIFGSVAAGVAAGALAQLYWHQDAVSSLIAVTTTVVVAMLLTTHPEE